ncbi:MAG: PAS domain-containing protein [bacterium]
MSRTETRVAIIGGGKACRELLTQLQADPERIGLTVVGVADPDPSSLGLIYARRIGITYTPSDYHEFFQRDDIDLIIELTGRNELREEIFRALPPDVHFIDHFGSRFFWDIFALTDERNQLRLQREHDILAERNKLQYILDSLPYEILVISKDFEVELANRTFLQAQGLTQDEIKGKYCYDIEHRTKPPCGVAVDSCPHAETLRAGRSVATVVSKIDSDGKERFVSVRTAPIHDELGEVHGVVEAIRDITHRVQTEEQLRDTRERLNQFIDTAPLFIYMKDLNLRYRVINRHALDILGQEESNVIGQTDFAIFPEATARALRQHEREALRSGKTVRFQGMLPVKDRDMYFDATLFPVMRGKDPVGLFGLIADTTELHDSEQELQAKDEKLSETQKLLEGVLENSRDLIFLADPNGRLLSVNRALEQSLGYEPGQLNGHPVSELFTDTDVQQEMLTLALTEGHVAQYEVAFKHRHDDPVICNVSLTAIDDPDGNPIEIMGICRDITTRLQLKADLVRTERLAAIGKMAAGVAHEINNPLAVIKTIAGVLEEVLEEDGAEWHPATRDLVTRATERLNFQVKRAASITHSLLGFARKSESGLKQTSVTDLLDESLDLLAPEINLVGCEIRREYATATPTVLTDPMLLEQIFVNLVKNAIDAVEEKTGTQGVIRLEVIPATDSVVVKIQDNGVGIPEDALGEIFDLFHTSKPAGKGTGLGLAIVHDIVKRLGCQIEVASEVGLWTCFTLTIPTAASG